MKKTLLLCLMTLISMVSARAMVNMTITVDKAQNVELRYSNGYGDVIPLINGENRLELDENQQPILVKAVPPATLVSVLVNSNPVGIIGESEARVGIMEGATVDITTSAPVSDTGLTISVNNPDWVVVKNDNGYGDALSLKVGDNVFELSEIGEPLSVTAAADCEIVSVKFNNEDLTPNASNAYLVTKITDGSVLDIVAKEVPANLPVTLSVVGNYDKLKVWIQDTPTEINGSVSTLSVPNGDVLKFDVAAGYVINGFSCGNHTFDVNEDGVYTVPVKEAMSISMSVDVLTAPAGSSVVLFDCTDPCVTFSEYDAQGAKIRDLDPARGYIVPNGNIVGVSSFISNLYFESVTNNGVAVEPVADKQYRITVEGDCFIKVETGYYVNVSCDRTVNEENWYVIGNLYVKTADGELVTSYNAKEGETLTIVGVPSEGYYYEYAVCLYPEKDEHFTDSYTITEADVEASMVMLKGVFSLDDRKAYLVRGNTVYVPETLEYLGRVLIDYNGETQSQMMVYEGATVTLVAELAESCTLNYFALWNTPTEPFAGNTYVVNGEDADSTDVIDITASITLDHGGIAETGLETSLVYDATAALLTAVGNITVYDLSGRTVAAGDGSVSVAHLPAGIYVASAGGMTLKIAK